MVKLKPCPFCGGKDSGILTTSYDGYWFAVFCENCMAQTRRRCPGTAWAVAFTSKQ